LRWGRIALKKIVVVGITGLVMIVLVVLGAWCYTNSQGTYSGKTESITFGIQPDESAALVYIAEDQHFFAENGLNVTLCYYDTGAEAVQGMENNEVDFAGTTEYPIVVEAFEDKNISVIVYDDKVQTMYFVGRKDLGIENVSDLNGKKIGLSLGTISEFYLGRFLDLHGIDPGDVDLVNLSPSQFVNATLNGEVDAIVCRQAYASEIQQQLGNDTVIWPVQSNQPIFGVIACRDDWASANPETISRFLKALAQADTYMMYHPAEAEMITQKNLNYTDSYMATVWPENQFSLALDQSLVVAMEDEGRWMIANNLTTAKTIPDYDNYICTKGLEEVNPEAVNIID
jgi:NitT/TauT family transport system substrate-binding protein